MDIQISRDGTLGVWLYRRVLTILKWLYRMKRRAFGAKPPEWVENMAPFLSLINIFGTLPTFFSMYFVPHHFFRHIRRGGKRGAWLYPGPTKVTLHAAAILLLLLHPLTKAGIFDGLGSTSFTLTGAIDSKLVLDVSIVAFSLSLTVLGPMICLLYDLFYLLLLFCSGSIFLLWGWWMMDHLSYGDWRTSIQFFVYECALCLLVWKLRHSQSLRCRTLLFNAKLDWARYIRFSLYFGSAVSLFLLPVAIIIVYSIGGTSLLFLYFLLVRNNANDAAATTIAAVLILTSAVVACSFVVRLCLYIYGGLLEASVRFLNKRFYNTYCERIAARAANIEVVDEMMNNAALRQSRLVRLRLEAENRRNELRTYISDIVREAAATEHSLRSDTDSLSASRDARSEGLLTLLDLSSLINRPDDAELLKSLTAFQTEGHKNSQSSGRDPDGRQRSTHRAAQVRHIKHFLREGAIVIVVSVIMLSLWWELYWTRRTPYILTQIHDDASSCADDPTECHDLGWITVLGRLGDQQRTVAAALALDEKTRTTGLLMAVDSGVPMPPALLNKVLEAIPVEERMSFLLALDQRGIKVSDRYFSDVPDQLVAGVVKHTGPDRVEGDKYTIADVENALSRLETMAEQLKEAGKTKLAEQARDDGSKCWEVMSGDSAWQVHHAEYAQIPESRWRSLWSKEFNKLTHWYQTKTTPRRPFEEDAKIEGVFNYIPAHEDIQPALAFSETLPPSSKFKVQFAIACRLADVQRQKDAMPIVRNLAQSQFKSKWASADGIELENLFRELSRVAHEEELRSISDRMQDSGPSRDYALSGIRAGMEEAQKKEIDTKPSTPSVQQEQANPKLAGDVAQLIEAHKYHEAWSFAKLRANSESEKWHIYDSIVEKLCHEGSGCQSKL